MFTCSRRAVGLRPPLTRLKMYFFMRLHSIPKVGVIGLIDYTIIDSYLKFIALLKDIAIVDWPFFWDNLNHCSINLKLERVTRVHPIVFLVPNDQSYGSSFKSRHLNNGAVGDDLQTRFS